VANGRVEIAWSCGDGEQLCLRWTERGGPPVNPPTRAGFGMHIVGRIVSEQSKGDMRLDWNPTGLECEIVLPIAGKSNPNGI
jgi:two-component system CheB/CheR fusion protein